MCKQVDVDWEFVSMVEKSTKFYALAMGILLIDLWAAGLLGAMVEGFILVAIALILYAVYSSITKASLEFMSTSLAYVCSILILFTFFLPVASWVLTDAWIGTTLLQDIVVGLHILGGLISFYAGWCARSEWSEYHERNTQKEYRTPDHGIPITGSGG